MIVDAVLQQLNTVAAEAGAPPARCRGQAHAPAHERLLDDCPAEEVSQRRVWGRVHPLEALVVRRVHLGWRDSVGLDPDPTAEGSMPRR